METARPVAGAGGAGDRNGQEQVQSNTRPPTAQHLSTLPTTAEARDFTLAKLRRDRLQHQLIVAHYDFIGVGIETGFIPHDAAERMLAEAFRSGVGAPDDDRS